MMERVEEFKKSLERLVWNFVPRRRIFREAVDPFVILVLTEQPVGLTAVGRGLCYFLKIKAPDRVQLCS